MRRLGEIGVGVLHELGLGLRVTEAIGLALDGCIDRAIGQHLFAVGKAPAALIVELTGERRRGEAERKRTGERRHHNSLDHGAHPWGYAPNWAVEKRAPPEACSPAFGTHYER